MDDLHELIKITSRCFYEDKHVIVLDMLLREEVYCDAVILGNRLD
jgi:transcription initiation factor IIE alpha subunit